MDVPIGSFTSTPELPNPPDLLQFSSTGITFRPTVYGGLDALLPWGFRFGGLVRWANFNMSYTGTEQTLIATPGGGTREATLQHDLNVAINAIAMEPYVRVSATNNLAVAFSVPIWFPFTTDYMQTMRFIDPPGLSFVDGSIEQITGEGALPNVNPVVFGLNAQAEGHWPVTDDKTVWLGGVVGIGMQLGSWQTNIPLRTVNPHLSMDVRYKPWITPHIIRRDTTYVRDTVVILSSRVTADSTELVSSVVEEFATADSVRVLITQQYRTYMPKPPAILTASLKLAFEGGDGTVSAEARVAVRTVERKRVVPILPIVVFDEEQVQIPSRYVSLSADIARHWHPSKALTGKDHWQYHVLNVVGWRLQNNRKTQLSLIVYDDGTPAGTDVAKARAEAVRDYLASTFGVQNTRLTIELRNGQRSQQPWVFLADSTRKLLQPIEATDTITETQLPRMRITPDVVSEAGVRSWKVNMTLPRSDTVHRIQGQGAVPATLVWDMNESLQPDDVFGAPVQVALAVQDVEGLMAYSIPATVSVLGAAATAAPPPLVRRLYVLRWIGADYLHTPDIELFGLSPSFDHIHVYPSAARREDFFVCDAPTTVHPVNSQAWFREGLVEPELSLFGHAEVYVKGSW